VKKLQNCQGIRCYLTILFASPLCFNKRKRAVVATGRTLVCGLRYHWSRIRPKNGNWIEKKLVKEL